MSKIYVVVGIVIIVLVAFGVDSCYDSNDAKLKAEADSLNAIVVSYRERAKEDSIRWKLVQDSLAKQDSIIKVAQSRRPAIKTVIDTFTVTVRESLPDSVKPKFDSLMVAHQELEQTYKDEIAGKDRKIGLLEFELASDKATIRDLRQLNETLNSKLQQATKRKSFLRGSGEKIITAAAVLGLEQIVRH